MLTAAAFVAALLPRLVRRGLFLDGLTYAAIARNMAEGHGHFWQPSYTTTIYPAFYEHPPLAFWLQSLWFRSLGDHWYVERLYCAAAAVAIAALTAWTWRAAYRADGGSVDDAAAVEWLPLLLWIAVPVVSWTIVGNLLEATVGVFAAAAVAAIAVGTAVGTRSAAAASGALSGLCVGGAVLSKGPVGLFPLVAPMMLAILPERRRRLIACAAAQLGTVALCALLIAALPAARTSILRYLTDQVAASLAGRREVSRSSWTILIALGPGVWLPMLVVAVLALLIARRWSPTSGRDRRVAAAFTLVGLAGTLPMLMSPKQSGFYVMPAVPFLAIGVAAIMRSTVVEMVRRIAAVRAAWSIAAVALLLAISTVAAIGLGAFDRDAERIAEMDRLASSVPRGDTIGLCPAANGDWVLHAWFQRRFEVSLDASATRHEWFLKAGPDAPDCPPQDCTPAATGGSLVLMRCSRR